MVKREKSFFETCFFCMEMLWVHAKDLIKPALGRGVTSEKGFRSFSDIRGETPSTEALSATKYLLQTCTVRNMVIFFPVQKVLQMFSK